MNSIVPTAMSITRNDASVGDDSFAAKLMSSFKELKAGPQSTMMKMMSAQHEKTLKSELKDSKPKKVKDPNAPKREQSANVLAWQKKVRDTQIESGQKVDEDGNPVFTVDLKTGEEKPVYNLTYKKAMEIASANNKAAAGGVGAPAPEATTTKTVTKKTIAAAKPAPTTIADRLAAAKKKIAEPVIEEDEEEFDNSSLRVVRINAKNYYQNDDMETWVCNPDGTRGAWIGIYNSKLKRFEQAPEP
jgi:hypothetical protein